MPELKDSIGRTLLTPHRSYLSLLKPLVDQKLIKGLAHISGDGLLNLARLDAAVGYIITDMLEIPPVFSYIQTEGNIGIEEMYGVFNMGVGFCVLVASDHADTALAVLKAFNNATRIAISLKSKSSTFLSK